MPNYVYNCEKCSDQYSIFMRISDYAKNKNQPCPKCHEIGTRIPEVPMAFYGEKVQDAEYNPAFGKVVKNKYERNELAKRFNAIEIGNEDPNKIHKAFDKQREEKRKKSYEDI